MATSSPKYRPVLTQEDVELIQATLKLRYLNNLTCVSTSVNALTSQEEALTIALMGKFSTLVSKIANNAISPAYTPKETDSPDKLLLDLGGELPESATSTHLADTSPGERRAIAYNKYKKNPTSCTAKELADAQEYRFNAGHMTPEEEEAYDAKQWGNL